MNMATDMEIVVQYPILSDFQLFICYSYFTLHSIFRYKAQRFFYFVLHCRIKKYCYQQNFSSWNDLVI